MLARFSAEFFALSALLLHLTQNACARCELSGNG